MTKPISSRSAKGTPKTVAKPGSNGTPPTDPDSVTISVPSPDRSEEWTGWTLQFANGGVHHVRVRGGRGRVSFSSGRNGLGGEVRIYRNESTKCYDAAFSGVTHIVSDRVETIPSKWGDRPRHGESVSEPAFGGRPPESEPEEKKEWVFASAYPSSGLKPTKVSTKKTPLNPEEFEF